MNKHLLLFAILIFLASCRTKKICPPCTVIQKTDSVVYHTDTVIRYQNISEIPLMKIKCFEYIGKDSLQIFRFPCKTIYEQKEVFRTNTVIDSSQIVYLTDLIHRMQRDSIKLSQKLTDMSNGKSKYQSIFYWLLGVVVLLAAFFIWRVTKK